MPITAGPAWLSWLAILGSVFNEGGKQLFGHSSINVASLASRQPPCSPCGPGSAAALLLFLSCCWLTSAPPRPRHWSGRVLSVPPVVVVQWGARALQWGEAAVSLQDPPVPRRLTACDRSGRRWRRPNGSGDTLSRCLLTLLVAGSGHSLTKGRARETASQREEEPVGCGEGGIWGGGGCQAHNR